MSDQIFLAAIIGPFYLIVGLSTLLYSRVWKKMVDEWVKNHLSLLGMMMFTLIFGLMIVTMHNQWEWTPYLILTFTGWSALLKGMLYFLLPEKSLRSLIKTFNKTTYYKSLGIFMILIGGWLTYLIYLA